MIKNMINSWFAVFVISMTNLLQFVITISIIFNDIICPKTTGFIFINGFMIVPTLFIMDGIWKHERTMFIFKISSTIILLIVYPLSLSYITIISIITCLDNNMLVWFFQGMSVPMLIWTLYKLIRYDNDKCTNTLPPTYMETEIL